jgi:hypothetical protein
MAIYRFAPLTIHSFLRHFRDLILRSRKSATLIGQDFE